VMLPRKLANDVDEAIRRRYRIVRLDTHEELPGEILSADADNGVCVMKEASGAAKDYSLGPGGFVIIGR
jgi:hypothetical protein